MGKRYHRSRERRRAERLNKIEDFAFWTCVVVGLGLLWLFVRAVT